MAVLAAIMLAVFCCPANIAFSMLLFVLQNHWAIKLVWLARFCCAISCCCHCVLLLIISTVLSWLLLLFIPLSNQAALLPPKPQKPLLPPINKKSNRIINQVPIPHIVIDVLVQSIIIDVEYKSWCCLCYAIATIFAHITLHL